MNLIRASVCAGAGSKSGLVRSARAQELGPSAFDEQLFESTDQAGAASPRLAEGPRRQERLGFVTFG